ncbi:MAG: hypothetical protein RMK19_08630 [Bacteroidia bacterium]|nr:hypothetical protein [Bacteroidia bacterium]MDW8016061.1 hypothetical protein [Bacteroidia bacterium]
MGWLALAYVLVLWGISWVVNRRARLASLDTFYVAQRKAHWLWVGYSMVGTALSALTFLSIPGSVRADGWTYLQVVCGYFLGYVGVAFGLLPLYYAHARASVYEYFRHTLGRTAEKTAALFFLFSRSIGSSLRLFLALWVLHRFFSPVPFPVLAAAALFLIILYTLQSGIAVIIYTDFFQTTVFLGAAFLTAVYLLQYPLGQLEIPTLIDPVPESPHFWIKDVVAGALIAFSMTGLDQDQMQKNLSLPSLRAAQKNLLLYGVLLFPVNLLFLWLGTVLWAYADWACLSVPPDFLFASVVEREGRGLQALFILGVAAAALSSADGTLTALTTATLRNLFPSRWETTRMKNVVLLGWAGIFWLLMMGYLYLPQERSIITAFLRFSGYTYGPLLGLFLFSRVVRKGEYAFVGWALPLFLGVAIVGERLIGEAAGYLSILWTTAVTVGGLITIQACRR